MNLRDLQRRMADDQGSAITEFIVVAVLILLPMAYIVMSVMRVQAATLASTQAAREAGRAFTQAPSIPTAFAAAQMAATLAFEDQGFALPPDALAITCPEGPCLTPGTSAVVELRWSVELPWLPASLSERAGAAIPMRVRHVAPVDVFRVTR